jgi:hypothetical protein
MHEHRTCFLSFLYHPVHPIDRLDLWPPLDNNVAGSWCELNFTNVSGDFAFQADGIIDIDTLNVKIEGVNRLFPKESGLTQQRISLDEIPDLDPGVQQSRD